MKPLFTIVTVTYNAAHTLGRTLRSVAEQTFGAYEHLVIDGGSNDGTIDMALNSGNPRVSVHTGRDKGIYDAMNIGISLARGEYYIFLNAGDKFHDENVLRDYADLIDANGHPGIVYGQTDIVNDRGEYLGPRHLRAPENLTLRSFAEGMVVCHQAMAVNREVALLYNLKYKHSSDYEWVIICLQHSRKNVYLPRVVVDYLGEGNTTSHHKASLIERFKIMCTYYGTLPTLARHLKFAARYIVRRRKAANVQ